MGGAGVGGIRLRCRGVMRDRGGGGLDLVCYHNPISALRPLLNLSTQRRIFHIDLFEQQTK